MEEVSVRVLVTGGAGFIGSHLCIRLLRDGCEVAILDDLNSFYSPALKRENLGLIGRHGHVRFKQGDICDQLAVRSLMRSFRPDAVIHLAARAGVRPSLKDPLLYEKVNIGGTGVVLECAKETAVRKFVFVSSSSVYGASSHVPFCEADPVCSPISPYAATKLAGEALCHVYARLYGIQMICLRLFTVYGPRQRPDLAIRSFAESIKAGRRIVMFGDGSSGRDYTYVEDIIDGIMSSLFVNCAFETINLGNSHPVSLFEVIQNISKVIGRRAEIVREPDQPGDVPITFADISKARRLLGYSPKTRFEDGIRKMVEWLNERDEVRQVKGTARSMGVDVV
jgi:UDP-glucuronate 4-epimerase